MVEAIVEELGPKGEVLSTVAEACPKADLATTTSSLGIGEIAAASGTAGASSDSTSSIPVPRMKLVEVCFPGGADGAREKALAWCAALGKTAVEVPDQAGFVVNRLLFPYLFDAVRMLERTGMEAGEVDTCMKLGAGHPMGPLALLDFVGLDVAEAIGDALYADSSEAAHKPPGLIIEMVGEGKLGRKSGAGFYTTTELPTLRRAVSAALAGDVPDHVRLADALAAGGLLDLLPGKLGLGQIVPAGQLERLERAFESRAELAPRSRISSFRTSSWFSLKRTHHMRVPPAFGGTRVARRS